MKQLTNIQSGLFLFGGVLMVIGAGSYAFMWHQEVVGFIYLIGACLFGGIQLMQSYEGRNMVIKRLKRIMSLADLLFIFSGMIMIDNAFGVTQSFFGNYATYLEVVYNKWVLLLLIAALLEIYTMHRLSSELSKENNYGPQA